MGTIASITIDMTNSGRITKITQNAGSKSSTGNHTTKAASKPQAKRLVKSTGKVGGTRSSRLIRARKLLGHTQNGMGQFLFASRSAVSDWETGRRNVPDDVNEIVTDIIRESRS